MFVLPAIKFSLFFCGPYSSCQECTATLSIYSIVFVCHYFFFAKYFGKRVELLFDEPITSFAGVTLCIIPQLKKKKD